MKQLLHSYHLSSSQCSQVILGLWSNLTMDGYWKMCCVLHVLDLSNVRNLNRRFLDSPSLMEKNFITHLWFLLWECSSLSSQIQSNYKYPEEAEGGVSYHLVRDPLMIDLWMVRLYLVSHQGNLVCQVCLLKIWWTFDKMVRITNLIYFLCPTIETSINLRNGSLRLY